MISNSDVVTINSVLASVKRSRWNHPSVQTANFTRYRGVPWLSVRCPR